MFKRRDRRTARPCFVGGKNERDGVFFKSFEDAVLQCRAGGNSVVSVKYCSSCP